MCFEKWEAITARMLLLIEKREQYAPEAFKASVLELMPEYARAANAAVARLQILSQIKCGEMRFNEGKPEKFRD